MWLWWFRDTPLISTIEHYKILLKLISENSNNISILSSPTVALQTSAHANIDNASSSHVSKYNCQTLCWVFYQLATYLQIRVTPHRPLLLSPGNPITFMSPSTSWSVAWTPNPGQLGQEGRKTQLVRR